MREHPRLITGAFFGTLIALIAVTCMGGCMATADPTNPGKKINVVQLQQQTIEAQKKFDDQANTLQAERQGIIDDYQAQAEQLKTKFQAAAAKLGTDTNSYTTAVASFNQKLAVASADLQAQAARNQKVVDLLGGVVQAAGTGTFGPLGTLGTSLLGAASLGLVGAWRDSASKSAALSVKNQQIAQLAAASQPSAVVMAAASGVGQNQTSTADGSAGPGALVQASGPALVLPVLPALSPLPRAA